jgi:hypothetical protein
MRELRARFDAAERNGRLYACGGSDGYTELNSIECFDPKVQKWSPLPDMKQSRASTGLLQVFLLWLLGICWRKGVQD